MKVFTSKGFSGHYPVGTAAVIVAESRAAAYLLMLAALAEDGLNYKDLAGNPEFKPEELTELDLTTSSCDILCNGNY